MKLVIVLAASVSIADPVEVWLTPEREAQLKSIANQPKVVKREMLGDETAVYHWSSGRVSTQHVDRIVGKPSKDSRAEKLEKMEREKQAIIDDLEAIKAKPTKQTIQDIIYKHMKGGVKK